jgi:hypothetical protein
MDVHCTTCGEPWDAYHLRHDAIYETGLTTDQAKAWERLPPKQRLSDHFRKQFATVGYEFGPSIMVLLRCPACPKGAKPDPEKAIIKAELAHLLGDDEDGLAATLEDFGL